MYSASRMRPSSNGSNRPARRGAAHIICAQYTCFVCQHRANEWHPRSPRCANGLVGTRPPRWRAIARPWRRSPSSSTGTSGRNRLRRAGDGAGSAVTSRLLRWTMDGRPLADSEIACIVRNWTVGELATMAASVGILAGYPGAAPRPAAAPARAAATAGGGLRRDPAHPSAAHRQPADRAARSGDRRRAAGPRRARVARVGFGQPRRGGVRRPRRIPARPRPVAQPAVRRRHHVCPGAPLARLQLRIAVEVRLPRVRLAPAADRPHTRARYPVGGFSVLPLRIERA